MKKSTRVAGIEAAMPFSTNTASRRRNGALASGMVNEPSAAVPAGGRREWAGGEPRIVTQAATTTSGAKSRAKRANPSRSPIDCRSTSGSAAARKTPTSAKPSRQAVTRVRSATSSEISAPCAW